MALDLTAGIPLASDPTVLDFWVNCRPSELTAGKESDYTFSPGKMRWPAAALPEGGFSDKQSALWEAFCLIK